jgi:dTDP-4-dehydrorhamnose reductase
MKLLVTGAAGAMGQALVRRARAHDVIALDRAGLDIGDAAAVEAALRSIAPAAVINAAAYTLVDRAEQERDAAFAANATGAGVLARACADAGVPLVHISTDYVFDGGATRPYREDDPVAPISVYGESKAEGERRVIAAGGCAVRTSWVFARGANAFVQKIAARLAAPGPLSVFADRHGCPTWADDLADALVELAERGAPAGIWHYAGDGTTTWHGLACAVAEELGEDPARIAPSVAVDPPGGARRPAYSVLDTAKLRAIGIVPRSWRQGLAELLAR